MAESSPKEVENTVGKGEIACTSNFSFFRNLFKRLLSQTHQKELRVQENAKNEGV